jgi:hypothetical protein
VSIQTPGDSAKKRKTNGNGNGNHPSPEGPVHALELADLSVALRALKAGDFASRRSRQTRSPFSASFG